MLKAESYAAMLTSFFVWSTFLTAFVDSIRHLPKASLPAQVLDSEAAVVESGVDVTPAMLRLLHALAGNSSFLAKMIQKSPISFALLCKEGPDLHLKELKDYMQRELPCAEDHGDLMSMLRGARDHMALLTAAADISGHWDVQTVTAHLSDFADLAIWHTADHLLRLAHYDDVITLPDLANPADGSGLVILAMGKLGGHELNYSSDIDLIILFDDDAPLEYRGRKTRQHFFTGLAQELCAILQDRTADGYVFRTDLRLRPDPRSTPLAVKLQSAITYYETLGQNWERAAMIKARAVYADPDAESAFAQAMQAFIWRRHLDFAAIADIDSIKRQINAKVGEQLVAAGHHVKLGRGGIREIEFYLQTQQLIWGGREAELRLSSSDSALHALHEAGHITSSQFTQLREAYWFLRRVEHYIQMTHDQQSHTVPEADEARAQLACFLGYDELNDFEDDLLRHCRRVHDIYADSMESAPSLSHGGNLVFTGVEADPDTLRTLLRMGFMQPLTVSDTIQSWHRGGRRATRSLKARQLLTELTPALLSAFSDTPNPDDAFKRFDEFIAKVPVGVQIFSLLSARLEVLQLLAMILGSAPAVSEGLAKNPALLDILVERDLPLSPRESLADELAASVAIAEGDEEEALRRLRQFRLEKHFHAGVKLLAGDIGLQDCGEHLSDIADVIIAETYQQCRSALEHKYGEVPSSEFAVLGLGKIGTRELTFGSDLDVIFIYDVPKIGMSVGNHPIESHTYFQRLASRMTHAFTLLMQEGRLYELDMRLRPGGNSGPLATHIGRLADYFTQDGWDVEALGLTRARVIYATSENFAHTVKQHCLRAVERGYDAAGLAQSVTHLRTRIAQQHPNLDIWEVKHRPGGLIDLSFIAQFLRLQHSDLFAGALALPNHEIYSQAAVSKVISKEDEKILSHAYRLQCDMQHVLRLLSTAQTITAESSPSLRASVARLMGQPDCDTLKELLREAQQAALERYQTIIKTR